MRSRAKVTLLLLGLVAGSAGLAAGLRSTAAEGQDEKKSPAKTFMRAKLADAQKVLEGLATEDFKLVRQGAEHMQVMSKATEWHVIEGPVYAEYSAEFRRCCEQLAKRADEKNVDAAALSYLQLTMACINCHKFVRSTRIVMQDRTRSAGRFVTAFTPPSAAFAAELE